MAIQDRDVQKALEVLASEFENLEDNLDTNQRTIADLEDDRDALDKANDYLLEQVTELKQKVKDLEEALAEAYLTQITNTSITESNE